ncbi:MAG TPA: phosphatidylserine/phosphatidylglycerophosphate/cardiolipin synthase family protein [Oscillatoriaceae cyanobacterium]
MSARKKILGMALALALVGCGQLGTPTASVPAIGGPSELNAQSLASGIGLDKLPVIHIPAHPTVPVAPMRSGNSAQVFVSPVQTLPAIKALINGAQKSVYIEIFALKDDSYGQQIVPLLIDKARAGVEVRLNLDFIGSRIQGGFGQMVDSLKKAGVIVHVYNPRIVRRVDGSYWFNITHRKEYIADGERALVGGVNMNAPFDTTTEDILTLWQGPVLDDLMREFDHDWTESGGKLSELHQTAVDATAGTTDGEVLVTSPAQGRFEGRDAVIREIGAAQHEILIQQQYIWDTQLVQALIDALHRGVQLRIMVPNPEQVSMLRDINTDTIEKLVKAGAQARWYRGVTPTAHLHTKYFSIDDRWAIDGSMNGDPMSTMDNQELDMATTDTSLITSWHQQLFERDWAEQSEPFVYHAGSPILRPFRNLLDMLGYYL